MELQTDKGIEYVWIQGQWKAEIIYDCKEYVQVVMTEQFEEALKDNPNARKSDFIYTFTPSLIETHERATTRR